MNEWLKRVWCVLRHDPTEEALIERAPGEVYLRCQRCGMKVGGVWRTGPLQVRSQLPGNPAHFRARVPDPELIAVPRSTTTTPRPPVRYH